MKGVMTRDKQVMEGNKKVEISLHLSYRWGGVQGKGGFRVRAILAWKRSLTSLVKDWQSQQKGTFTVLVIHKSNERICYYSDSCVVAQHRKRNSLRCFCHPVVCQVPSREERLWFELRHFGDLRTTAVIQGVWRQPPTVSRSAVATRGRVEQGKVRHQQAEFNLGAKLWKAQQPALLQCRAEPSHLRICGEQHRDYGGTNWPLDLFLPCAVCSQVAKIKLH